ncbi:MAG: hypothetical protein R2705_22480 [Ilumatobacteraceae bacterium]
MVADLQLVIIAAGATSERPRTPHRGPMRREYVRLLGTVNDADLLGWYRRAWTDASASVARAGA